MAQSVGAARNSLQPCEADPVEPTELATVVGVEFIGRLAHGEGTGAYEVRTGDGTRAVLKLYTGDVLDLGSPPGLTEALRARGYPAPATLETGAVGGTVYEIQELAPGAPVENLPAALVPNVLELIALQRDVGSTGRRPWVDDMVTSVLDGRTGYCEHAAMAAHSDRTRDLLDRLRRIADGARNVQVPHTDVVHFDFSPYNILASGDRITAVVDWNGATSGDAAFDLVTLASYTYDFAVRDELLAAAAASTDPGALALYAAHMVLRQVDWSLRHDDAGTVEWFLGIGSALLAKVES
jgi:Phosphotransferase enzyme family